MKKTLLMLSILALLGNFAVAQVTAFTKDAFTVQIQVRSDKQSNFRGTAAINVPEFLPAGTLKGFEVEGANFSKINLGWKGSAKDAQLPLVYRGSAIAGKKYSMSTPLDKGINQIPFSGTCNKPNATFTFTLHWEAPDLATESYINRQELKEGRDQYRIYAPEYLKGAVLNTFTLNSTVGILRILVTTRNGSQVVVWEGFAAKDTEHVINTPVDTGFVTIDYTARNVVSSSDTALVVVDWRPFK